MILTPANPLMFITLSDCQCVTMAFKLSSLFLFNLPTQNKYCHFCFTFQDSISCIKVCLCARKSDSGCTLDCNKVYTDLSASQFIGISFLNFGKSVIGQYLHMKPISSSDRINVRKGLKINHWLSSSARP